MLSDRIAKALVRRGYRDSIHTRRAFGKGILDPELYVRIGNGSVLVTVDEDMLTEHASQIQRRAPTLAIVDMRAKPDAMTADQYQWDVTHRHAHRIAEQEPGSIYAYRQARRRRLV